jgi:hypothetical protein
MFQCLPLYTWIFIEYTRTRDAFVLHEKQVENLTILTTSAKHVVVRIRTRTLPFKGAQA